MLIFIEREAPKTLSAKNKENMRSRQSLQNEYISKHFNITFFSSKFLCDSRKHDYITTPVEKIPQKHLFQSKMEGKKEFKVFMKSQKTKKLET